VKKLSYIAFVFLFIISCNFKEKFDKQMQLLDKVKVDLETHFNHQPIDIVSRWSTEEENNYLVITLYEYDMDVKTNSQLESLANSIIFRVTAKNANFENKQFIEVRFTNEPESEKLNSFTSFRVDYKGAENYK
jgi:hypothetical protein